MDYSQYPCISCAWYNIWTFQSLACMYAQNLYDCVNDIECWPISQSKVSIQVMILLYISIPLSQAFKCMLNLCAASSSGTVVIGTASEWRNGKMWKYGLAAYPDQMNLPHDGNDVRDWPLRLVHKLNTPYTLRFEFIYPPKLSEACYIHIISNCTGETGFNGNRVLIHGRED